MTISRKWEKIEQKVAQYTHVVPKQVLEEDEKEKDLCSQHVSSHHQFASVYFDHNYLNLLLFL